MSKREGIDLYMAIYKVYFKIIKESGFKLIDENFCLGASSVNYNQGILSFLQKLNFNVIISPAESLTKSLLIVSDVNFFSFES